MSEKVNPKSSIAWSYTKALFRFAGLRAYVSLGVMIFLGLTQGVGLLMLIPFLHLIGLEGSQGVDGGLASFVGDLFDAVALPLTLPVVLCVYVTLVFAHAIVQRCQAVLNAGIVHGFTKFLRDQLYQAITHADWLSVTRTKAAEITHVLTSGLETVGSGTHQSLMLISTAVIAAVHIGVALKVSAPLTGLALACGAGLLAALRFYHRLAFETGEALHQARNQMFAAVTDHLGSLKVTKSYGAEQRHVKRFRSGTQSMATQLVRFAKVYAHTLMFYELGAVVTLAGLFYVAVAGAHMPPADMLLMIFLFARVLPKFSRIQQGYQLIRNILPSYQAALEMQKRFEAAKEPAMYEAVSVGRIERGIEIRGVSFRYDRERETYALRGVDLHIPPRGMTAIVGPSGAGKTTLADLLMGLLIPEKGEVLVDGESLDGERLHRWRRSVGYVPQETFLFHDTVRANLLWARTDAGEDRLWHALGLADADQFVSQLPKGLDTVVGDRGVLLSGGQRQRIALARALLRRPSLLLLDEATSTLDSESERRIQEAVERLNGEMAVLVIAHRLSTVRRADRIVVFDAGQVVESGTWEELATRPGGRFRSMVEAEEELRPGKAWGSSLHS